MFHETLAPLKNSIKSSETYLIGKKIILSTSAAGIASIKTLWGPSSAVPSAQPQNNHSVEHTSLHQIKRTKTLTFKKKEGGFVSRKLCLQIVLVCLPGERLYTTPMTGLRLCSILLLCLHSSNSLPASSDMVIMN